jgi:small-conductance mechanosensitive channel
MFDFGSELLNDLATAGVILAGAAVVAWLANFILERVIHRLIHKTQTRLDDVIVHAIGLPFRLAVFVIGVHVALQQIRDTPSDVAEVENRIFFFIYAILIYMTVVRLINGISHWAGAKAAGRSEAGRVQPFVGLLRGTLVVIASVIVTITILSRFGIEVNGLVASLGIGSLAIALAAQETLADLIAGFVIMIDRPFRINDRVEVLDINTWGDVKEIGLRSTRILTRDNRMVAVPNSVIGKGLVVNYSIPNTAFRVETNVGIAYGSDVDKAREVMIEAIRAEGWVMKNRPVEALLLEFGESGLNFRVRCWIEHYIETRRIIDAMNTALYRALNRAEISIPFPQRDLHLVSSRVRPFEVRVNGVESS